MFLTELEVFYCFDNKITEIPNANGQLSNLVEFDISNDLINKINVEDVNTIVKEFFKKIDYI